MIYSSQPTLYIHYVDKVLNIAKTITTLKVKLPASRETLTKTMILTTRHKSIEQLFDKDFWKIF